MAVDFWYASAIEALTALKVYELQENVRYVVLSCVKEFGQSDIPDKRVKVHWNSDGQPFIVLGNKRFGCHHGHDKNAKKNQRKKASVVEESTHNYCEKRRRHPIIETKKKVGCPAKVIMKEVLFFPQFKAEERRRAKTKVAARVRSNLHDGERRFIMELKNDHENHPLGEVDGKSQRIDPDISSKIKELAEDGVNDVGEMARHIENYVRESLPQVNLSPLNRRVHPLNRTIRYHMGKGRKGPDVQDDQLSLSALMQDKKSSHPNDVIFLRTKNSTSVDGHSEKRTWSQAFSSSASTRTDKVYELRTYNVNPKDTKAILAVINDWIHVRMGYSKMLGFWLSEIGGMNDLLHLWEYDSLAHRAKVRQEIAADPVWQSEAISKILPMVQRQDNCVVKCLPGTSLAQPQGTGVYEIQKIHLDAVDLKSLGKDVSELSRPGALLVGSFYCIVGDLSSGFLLWQHQDLGKFEEPHLSNITPGVRFGQSRILLPTTFSGLK